MDVYVRATLLSRPPGAARWDHLCVATSEPAPRSDGGHWRWSAAMTGGSLELDIPLSALRPRSPELHVHFELRAPNDILSDSVLGKTHPLPLSRFADGALHTVMIEPRGDLTLSLTAPTHVPRDVVRAVAVSATSPTSHPSALNTIPLVEARAVNVDGGQRIPGPPPRYESTACCLATPLR